MINDREGGSSCHRRYLLITGRVPLSGTGELENFRDRSVLARVGARLKYAWTGI